ncbi:ATP-binding protein [Vibrio parahaemolyticus]|uniref:ATP-binding protein n=2 Tax=Vibrio parahaemolyticus TaxID=670 RepID=UPI00100E1013|nr:ATP-binding protein [Vibrio parahaemolyticus]RXP56878.1 ATP-binding protein [Vibrio parahaemolyticus]RXP58401.1 ATP-binding protein [Vibrio parahaemolyticus]RXP69249.1 ATP-binding protein [Vibrio parahaemolyticus]RXP71572.1 ATP-binding protein [Vibrio parahaemolyticus]RXP97747.1 ATP-binding protein [Vibrio parahaemolyticus]
MTTNYISHPNPALKGNPLIEALGLPLLPQEFIKQTTLKSELELDWSAIPDSHYSYYARSMIDNLHDSYVVQDEAPRLYDTIFRMLERGYANRNPLEYGDFKQLNNADDTTFSETQEITLRQTASQSSFLLAGLSGRGKTSMIESLLSTIPQKIYHTEYKDKPFHYDQIVWLKVDVPTTKGQRALLWRILEAIDSVAGESYYESHTKSNVTSLMIAVRKALLVHGVGLIILDEAQNLSKPSTSDKVGNNENATLRFVEELFNKVGVPLLLVGTLTTLSLFSQEMTTARRIGKDGSLILEQCNVESSFWKRFIKQMCTTSILKNQSTDLDTITRHTHHLSAGIPAIASSLIRSTMTYLTYLPAHNQDLSIAALNFVFKEQFRVISGALNALKRGKYYQYEDCAPLTQLHDSEANYFELAEQSNTAETETKRLTTTLSAKPKLSDKEQQLFDSMSPSALLRGVEEDE